MSDQKADLRSAVSHAGRAVRTRAVDSARQTARLLPGPARAQLRAVVTWSDRLRRASSLEEWSQPLIVRSAGTVRDGLHTGLASASGSGVVEPARSDRSHVTSGGDLPALRCLVVTSRLDLGGLQEVAALLARRLPAYRLQTAVLDVTSVPSPSGQPSGRLGRMLRSNGVEVHETDVSCAPDWIERWRPDVISAHGALPDCLLETARRIGVPYVETLHGMHDLFQADWQAEAARSARLSAIVSVSELVRQQYLAGNRAFPPGRIVTIPNGVDDERRSGGDREAARDCLGLADEYLFVSLSRHCLQKNTYGLVAAFGELAKSRRAAHLVIAGKVNDVRYYRRVQRLRETLPCRNRIHLRDHLAAPAELLAAADGFVLDSFFEGWPLAPMEALFAGLPVVLSDVGGAREQVGNDPVRGYLVANPLADPLNMDWESMAAARYRTQANRDDLTTAMDRLILGREDYLGNRGRLAAESATRFSADRCLAQHAAVLRALASGADLPSNDALRVMPQAPSVIG